MWLYILLGVLLIIVGFVLYGAFATLRWQRENRGETIRAESEHFHWYLFYYNKNDKRIFVPKRTGGGFTINFANPLSVIAGILFVGTLLALTILQN